VGLAVGFGLGLCEGDVPADGAPSSGTSAHPARTAATTSATPTRFAPGLTTPLL